MTALFVALPGNDLMADKLATLCGGERGGIETRQFPDGETYLRFRVDPTGRDVVLVSTLVHPNEAFLPLAFAAGTARELGARQIGLVAPYLGYMRQDQCFQPGEGVTSRHFAALLSQICDWLITVDPHLHRYRNLGDIYPIPASALHAGSVIADWIRHNIGTPFIIGPDEESVQWVSEIARDCGAPFAVLHKRRLGDRDVRIAPDGLNNIREATPVLVDDIISSGETMLEAIRLVKSLTTSVPIAIGVHGIFADGSDARIEAAGVTLVTTNSIPHASNRIDVANLLALAISKQLRRYSA
jgi:ribose-phosphate pyrophosphokinase